MTPLTVSWMRKTRFWGSPTVGRSLAPEAGSGARADSAHATSMPEPSVPRWRQAAGKGLAAERPAAGLSYVAAGPGRTGV